MNFCSTRAHIITIVPRSIRPSLLQSQQAEWEIWIKDERMKYFSSKLKLDNYDEEYARIRWLIQPSILLNPAFLSQARTRTFTKWFNSTKEVLSDSQQKRINRKLFESIWFALKNGTEWYGRCWIINILIFYPPNGIRCLANENVFASKRSWRCVVVRVMQSLIYIQFALNDLNSAKFPVVDAVATIRLFCIHFALGLWANGRCNSLSRSPCDCKGEHWTTLVRNNETTSNHQRAIRTTSRQTIRFWASIF